VTKGDIESEIVYESDYADEADLRLGKIEGEIAKWKSNLSYSSIAIFYSG